MHKDIFRGKIEIVLLDMSLKNLVCLVLQTKIYQIDIKSSAPCVLETFPHIEDTSICA
jgi:uncharacterized protein YfeS